MGKRGLLLSNTLRLSTITMPSVIWLTITTHSACIRYPWKRLGWQRVGQIEFFVSCWPSQLWTCMQQHTFLEKRKLTPWRPEGIWLKSWFTTPIWWSLTPVQEAPNGRGEVWLVMSSSHSPTTKFSKTEFCRQAKCHIRSKSAPCAKEKLEPIAHVPKEWLCACFAFQSIVLRLQLPISDRTN